MRYVILRDDDTNALTPVECLERLYRPFLARGLPVNLAVIPDVATGTTLPNGAPEGYLSPALSPSDGERAGERGSIPIASNQELVGYLLANHGFPSVLHCC